MAILEAHFGHLKGLETSSIVGPYNFGSIILFLKVEHAKPTCGCHGTSF
jgi:hypothetical protein